MSRLFRVIAVLLVFLFSEIAFAQAAPSDYTTGYRYDVLQRLTGLIRPDPDGGGSLRYAAERYIYDADGLLLTKESGELASWQAQGVAPSSWSGFTILQTTTYSYDALGRKLAERVKGSNGITFSLTQFSYDAAGRLQCSTVRMNENLFTSPPSNACSLGAQGSNGPDRITQNYYDAAGQLVQVHKAVGTSIQQAYATYSFTQNGKQEHVIDANGNRAKLEYDGFDRQSKWIFPSATKPPAFNPATPTTALATAGAINTDDYEQYGYDANGNRSSFRKRDGADIAYQYDALNRITMKDVDAYDERTELASADKREIHYTYDLLGMQTSARFDTTSGPGALSQYDGFGRLSMTIDSLLSGNPSLTYQYDHNGNRIKITHPDAIVFDMVFDKLNRLTQIKKGATILAAPSYNRFGLVSGIDRYDTALDQTLGYDAAGRLSSLELQYGSNAANVGWTFANRNAASQLQNVTRSNDAYAWTARVNANSTYSVNGLNQYTEVGSAGFCYDANGNLTADDENAYLYDVENRLVEMRVRESLIACPGASSGYAGPLLARLRYDPMGRLYETFKYVNGTLTDTSRFLYDGDALVFEYDATGGVRNRYVHGSDLGSDDPLIWYAGGNTASSDIRNLYSDSLGSIALVMGANGAALAINTYDEWGAPSANNMGRFQFTGQIWLHEIGMYYYKARIYSPRLGRFLQTDPIGYWDQFNLYTYINNDPVNATDPTGMYEDPQQCTRNPSCTRYGSLGGNNAQQTQVSAFSNGEPVLAAASDAAAAAGKAGVGRAIAGGSVLGLALAVGCDSPPCAIDIYVTYTKTNPVTGLVYSGRTSITIYQSMGLREAGLLALRRRDAGHHMNKKGYGPAVLDKVSTNRASIRGREQQLIDYHGGAQSVGGTSGNAVNGIWDYNPAWLFYMLAADSEFGHLPSNRPGD